MNHTNRIWKQLLDECYNAYDYEVSPRGMKVRELIAKQYRLPMIAYMDISSRKINYPFMFAEAHWILSGSNRLSDITPYMKVYSRYSDDGVFLGGAYGPKISDQLPYIIRSLREDKDSRQAVLNIWREKPGNSKDIPCTTQMQFLIRNNELELIVSMRSQDIVLGFTYDVFTFSMVGLATFLLLKEYYSELKLGALNVNVGSLHLYETHFDKVPEWVGKSSHDDIESYIHELYEVTTFDGLLLLLDEFKRSCK